MMMERFAIWTTNESKKERKKGIEKKKSLLLLLLKMINIKIIALNKSKQYLIKGCDVIYFEIKNFFKGKYWMKS